MTHPKGIPNERHPHGLMLPRFWHAQHNFGIPYRPKDKIQGKPAQEDWGSVARKFGVDVDDLIFFNFMTHNPEEVNWYLHHYVGCDKVSPSGNNWMFSNSANPGIIYIPPADTVTLDVDPIPICGTTSGDIDKFKLLLVGISKGMSGNKWGRIKKLTKVIMSAGDFSDLWYYNDLAISVYVDKDTGDSRRREMIKDTNQTFPFDGNSGVTSQQGSMERTRGRWQLHAIDDLFDEFACRPLDVNALKNRLEQIDEQMYKGWHELDLVSALTGMGGGSTVSDLVYQFIHHVQLLTTDKTNLYSAFAP